MFPCARASLLIKAQRAAWDFQVTFQGAGGLFPHRAYRQVDGRERASERDHHCCRFHYFIWNDDNGEFAFKAGYGAKGLVKKALRQALTSIMQGSFWRLEAGWESPQLG